MSALAERAEGARVLPRPARPPRAERFQALVVSANRAARAIVVRRLQTLGADAVVEAGSLAESRSAVCGLPPRSLVVVDLALPDGSGLALVDDLRAGGWAHGLVLTPQADAPAVRGALASGARGLLVTGDRRTARIGLVGSRMRQPLGLPALSEREVQVVQLVADGRSNRDVGLELGLSALTVKSHLARIGRKLGTGDRAEMVAILLRAGLIT